MSGRKRQGYKDANGKRVPGVTTIIGKFKDPGGLIHWAWKLGMDGQDYRDVRDSAAGAGKICHGMIEAKIRGRSYAPPESATREQLELAKRGFEAFERWAKMVELDITHTEVALVSELHRFGGTPDAIGRVSGELSIIDWKTSSSVYPEYIEQIGAYAQLWKENHGQDVQGAHLLRLGKEDGSFHHHSWPLATLEMGRASFLRKRELYDIHAKLKKVA